MKQRMKVRSVNVERSTADTKTRSPDCLTIARAYRPQRLLISRAVDKLRSQHNHAPKMHPLPLAWTVFFYTIIAASMSTTTDFLVIVHMCLIITFFGGGSFLKSCGCSTVKSKTPPQETSFTHLTVQSMGPNHP